MRPVPPREFSNEEVLKSLGLTANAHGRDRLATSQLPHRIGDRLIQNRKSKIKLEMRHHRGHREVGGKLSGRLERFSFGLNGATALERLERSERLFLKAEKVLRAK
jgi:hypothetical protein